MILTPEQTEVRDQSIFDSIYELLLCNVCAGDMDDNQASDNRNRGGGGVVGGNAGVKGNNGKFVSAADNGTQTLLESKEVITKVPQSTQAYCDMGEIYSNF